MKFDETMLDKIEYLSFSLENCESFDVDGEDILAFCTSEIKGTGPNGAADDGQIVISKRAFRNLISSASELYADGTEGIDHAAEENVFLGSHLLACCDICQIYVKFKEGDGVLFSIPYDPIGSNLTQTEADHSNCPSAELDGNGDLIILFGKSSRGYHRTDNNYFDLVIGLKDEIKGTLVSPVRVKIGRFSNRESTCSCPRLLAELRFLGGGGGKEVGLVFEDVRDLFYDISMNAEKKRRLWMSRISTGAIFVEIEGVCSFLCKGVKTYAELAGEGDETEENEGNEKGETD